MLPDFLCEEIIATSEILHAERICSGLDIQRVCCGVSGTLLRRAAESDHHVGMTILVVMRKAFCL